jgi:hypothetical protein
MRLTHSEANPVISEKFRSKHPDLGLKREAASAQSKQARCEPGKAAGSIATHFGLTSICIVITHPWKLGCAFCRNQAIGTDATMAVAEMGDLFPGKAEGAVTVIHHDKVIPSSVHFGELQSH